jgi:hypothetical protein
VRAAACRISAAWGTWLGAISVASAIEHWARPEAFWGGCGAAEIGVVLLSGRPWGRGPRHWPFAWAQGARVPARLRRARPDGPSMAQRGLAGIHAGYHCASAPPRGLLEGGRDPKAGPKAERGDWGGVGGYLWSLR